MRIFVGRAWFSIQEFLTCSYIQTFVFPLVHCFLEVLYTISHTITIFGKQFQQTKQQLILKLQFTTTAWLKQIAWKHFQNFLSKSGHYFQHNHKLIILTRYARTESISRLVNVITIAEVVDLFLHCCDMTTVTCMKWFSNHNPASNSLRLNWLSKAQKRTIENSGLYRILYYCVFKIHI